MRSFVDNWRPVIRSRESSLFAFLSLFTSIGTLLCCALPSLLVLFGLGAAVASTVAAVPLLVSLSHHKPWVFGTAALLIALGFVYTYRWAPRLRVGGCDAASATACGHAARLSRALLWISTALFCIGFFVAFLLGPILARRS